MFNTITVLAAQTYGLFINLNFNCLFICVFIYMFLSIFNSVNNINFFFNITVFLILLTCYLFKINVGAFAGFLFLCETVSLFALFIILNKISNNEIVLKNKIGFYKNYFIVVCFVVLFYFFSLNSGLITQLSLDNFFVFELLNTNDFWTTAILFFYNVYNFYLLIIIFLTLITVLLVLTINAVKNNTNSNLKSNSRFLNFFFKKLFQENNFISFKNKIVINFFKKSC